MVLPTYLPDYGTIQKQTIEPMLQEVLTGKTTAEALLTTWAEGFEKAYQEYNTQIKK